MPSSIAALNRLYCLNTGEWPPKSTADRTFFSSAHVLGQRASRVFQVLCLSTLRVEGNARLIFWWSSSSQPQ